MLPAGPPYSADKELINELVESVWHLAHMHPPRQAIHPSIHPASALFKPKAEPTRGLHRKYASFQMMSTEKRTSYFTQTKRRITDNSSANGFFFRSFSRIPARYCGGSSAWQANESKMISYNESQPKSPARSASKCKKGGFSVICVWLIFFATFLPTRHRQTARAALLACCMMLSNFCYFPNGAAWRSILLQWRW